MTIADLLSNLCSHGVEENLDYGLFINYLNTALFKIYNDVIIPKKGRVFAYGTKPAIRYDEINHYNDVEQRIELEGVAYSMRICGITTNVSIYTGGETQLLTYKDDNNIVKGFLTDNKGTLILGGKNSYTIYDLCIFDDVPTRLAAYLPDGMPIAEYDISESHRDFAAFLSPPVDRFGNILDCVKTVDSRLIIDSYYKGDVIFTYRRRPTLTHPNYDIDIDIPEQYEMLLVPLVLYFFYIELDDDRANSYMNLYKILLENIVYPTNNASIECDKVITNGW